MNYPAVESPAIRATLNLTCRQLKKVATTPDQNVVDKVDGTSTGSTVGDAVLGAVPIVGDMIDLISNGIQLLWYGFIDGEACVAGNNVNSAETEAKYTDGNGDQKDLDLSLSPVPNWEEAKYYQRFVEDQRLAESEGLVEKSAISVFLEEYYRENPLDNSYEGVLARYSGLTKDQVIATLDLMDYYTFLADYDPSDKSPVNIEQAEIEYTVEDNQKENIYNSVISKSYDGNEKRRLATIC